MTFILAVQCYGETGNANNIWTREKLFGDWGGERTKLAENGITLDMDLVQSYQGVLSGGTDKSWKYGGSMNYMLNFDFQKMGLWQGAFLNVRLEQNYGSFVNGRTGTLAGSNTDGLFPLPNYHQMNMSEVKFTQFLAEDFAVFFGKLNTLDGDNNVFAGGRGKTNFMHQNFVFNPIGIRTIPYSSLGAGAVKFFPDAMAKDPATLSFMVLGADGQPNTSGFDEDFENGQTYAFGYRQPTNFWDKSGSHTFGFTYGTKNYTLLTQDPRLVLVGLIGLPVTFTSEDYGDFLIAIYEEWVRNDVGEIFIMNFEWAFNAWIGEPSSVCIHANRCGRSLVIEHNGDVYTCDHYVYPKYKLGNISCDDLLGMSNKSLQSDFGVAKETALPRWCMECEVLPACRGGCPKHRFNQTIYDEPGLHYLCDGYRKFFLHIRKYLRVMTQLLEHGRPLSLIMDAMKGPLVLHIDNP